MAEQEPDQLAARLAAVRPAVADERLVPVGVVRADLVAGVDDGVLGPGLRLRPSRVGPDGTGLIAARLGAARPLAAQPLDGFDGDAAVAARRPRLGQDPLVGPPPDGADVDAEPLGGGADAEEEGTGHR